MHSNNLPTMILCLRIDFKNRIFVLISQLSIIGQMIKSLFNSKMNSIIVYKFYKNHELIYLSAGFVEYCYFIVIRLLAIFSNRQNNVRNVCWHGNVGKKQSRKRTNCFYQKNTFLKTKATSYIFKTFLYWYTYTRKEM